MRRYFIQTIENLVNSLHKYWDYFDIKAKEAPLKLSDFCLLLNFSTEHGKIST